MEFENEFSMKIPLWILRKRMANNYIELTFEIDEGYPMEHIVRLIRALLMVPKDIFMMLQLFRDFWLQEQYIALEINCKSNSIAKVHYLKL